MARLVRMARPRTARAAAGASHGLPVLVALVAAVGGGSSGDAQSGATCPVPEATRRAILSFARPSMDQALAGSLEMRRGGPGTPPRPAALAGPSSSPPGDDSAALARTELAAPPPGQGEGGFLPLYITTPRSCGLLWQVKALGGDSSTGNGRWAIQLSNPSGGIRTVCTPELLDPAADCTATIHVRKERIHIPPAADSFGETRVNVSLGAPPPAPVGGIDVGLLVDLSNAVSTDAAGHRHLYFHSIDIEGNLKRCGEVDAARHMPERLFEPENLLELAAYAEATLRLYHVPVLGNAVMLGRCGAAGYTQQRGRVMGIDWTPNSLMGPICVAECKCSYHGLDRGVRLCREEVDDPIAGSWCSLCAPKTACSRNLASREAGCLDDTITVQLYYQPQNPEPRKCTSNRHHNLTEQGRL